MVLTEISQWTTNWIQHGAKLCEQLSALWQYQRLGPKEVHSSIDCKVEGIRIIENNNL